MQSNSNQSTPILHSTYQDSQHISQSADIFIPDKPYIQKLVQHIIKYLNERQWRLANRGLSYLMEQEYQNIEEFLKLAQLLAVLWIENPGQSFLAEFLDFFVFHYMDAGNKQVYNKLVFNVLVKSLESLAQFCKKQIKEDEKIKYKEYQELQIEKWELTLQILRSYVHRSLNLGQNSQQIWMICWTVSAIMLNGSQLNTSYIQKCPQNHKPIFHTLHNLLPLTRNPTFLSKSYHSSCLLFRIFIKQALKFISQDNKLVLTCQRYPSINNCSLLMKIIESQFLNQNIIELTSAYENKITNKLDCLVLLINIMETSLPRCQNYNQVFEYAVYVVYLLQQYDEEYRNKQKKNQQEKEKQIKQKKQRKQGKIIIGPILFYCGQLISLILYRNSEWFVKFCRNQAKNTKQSPHRTLSKLLQVYKHTVKSILPKIQYLQHQQIIYKRLVLGFCGLLKINSMQTAIEQTIIQLTGSIIKIIEEHHGWHDQEEQGKNQEEEIMGQNEDLCCRGQGKGEESMGPMEMEIQKLKKKQKKQKQTICQQLAKLGWNQEYYSKNQNNQFQKIGEVQELVKAMWSIKDRNAHIFQNIMQNFDEKQSILWMVQLQKYGNERQDYGQDSDD